MSGKRRAGGPSIQQVIIGGMLTTLILFLIVANVEPQVLANINESSEWYTQYMKFRSLALAGLGLTFIGFLILGAVYIYQIAKSAFSAG